MFVKEYSVKGKSVKGQIISNWSTKSYYALKLKEIGTTLGEHDLDELISELTAIRDKVMELNIKHIPSK
jgi:hypothetical protein